MSKQRCAYQIIPKLKLPLDHCNKALEDVDRELKPDVKLIEGDKGSRWRATRAAFLWKYREKDMIALQRNLGSSQAMLDSAIHVVHV